ncbi:MAG: type II toxin-antitoxin system RelE/ParE family toxin [Acidobacteriota bacterium]
MTAPYEVRFDRVALEALEEAADYIEEHSGAPRAATWFAKMRAGIQKLEALPRAFAAVSLRRGRPVHSKLVMTHRVFYIVDDPSRVVYIIDVVHTARETKLAAYRKRD